MLVRPIQGRPGGVYWYVLQTHTAATIAFKRFCDLLSPHPGLLKHKPHKTEKCVTFFHDAKVYFKSGENFEDLRMETLDGAVIDEVRQQHPELWPRIIRPMLARRKGWCDFLSTPNGLDHFYDLFETAKMDPEWAWFHAPSADAWWWTPEEIASARSQMSADEFAQEIEADFRELGKGKVYLTHGIHNHSEVNPFVKTGTDLWSPYLPIIVGLDFNVAVMPWVLGQYRNRDWYWGDEVALTNTNTEMQVPLLVEKIKGHKAGVELIGDASGKSLKTSSSGNTDYSIICKALQEAGIPFVNKTPESNPPIKDRVNSMNSCLRTADGQVHFWYSPTRCTYLKKDLERVVWKEGAQGAMFEKTKDLTLTHASDAAGYPVAFYFEGWKPKPGVTRVIVRQ